MVTVKTKIEEKENVQEKPGFFSKLILLWVVPFLYTIALGMIILHFTGVSISTQIKWVDKQTEKYFAEKGPSEKTAQQTKKTSTVQSKDNSKNEMDKPNTKIMTKTEEQQIKSSINESQTLNSINAYSVEDTFANMDPRGAAKLLNNMNQADALMTLKELSVDVRNSIIEEMSEEDGAKFTVALAKGIDFETTTNSSSQLFEYMKPDQIAGVLKGIKNKDEVFRLIHKLDPQTASEVISQLDPEVAGWIITRMN